MGFHRWDPEEMDKIKDGPTFEGMYPPEHMHREDMIKKVFWVNEVMVIVTGWDTVQ